MNAAGSAHAVTPGATGKPGAVLCRRTICHATGSYGKTTNTKHLAVGVGKGVPMTAVHFNHLPGSGDPGPAMTAAIYYSLVTGICFFVGFTENSVFGRKIDFPA